MPDKLLLNVPSPIQIQMQIDGGGLDVVMTQMIFDVRNGMTIMEHVHCSATREEFVKGAIRALVGTARTGVVKAILGGFGGTMGLLMSLYNSSDSKKDHMVTEVWELDYVEVGLDNAFSWIEAGCLSWRAGAMG